MDTSITLRVAHPDDVILWPDGVSCYRSELHEFNHKSDDYEVLPCGSERWLQYEEAQA